MEYEVREKLQIMYLMRELYLEYAKNSIIRRQHDLKIYKEYEDISPK